MYKKHEPSSNYIKEFNNGFSKYNTLYKGYLNTNINQYEFITFELNEDLLNIKTTDELINIQLRKINENCKFLSMLKPNEYNIIFQYDELNKNLYMFDQKCLLIKEFKNIKKPFKNENKFDLSLYETTTKIYDENNNLLIIMKFDFDFTLLYIYNEENLLISDDSLILSDINIEKEVLTHNDLMTPYYSNSIIIKDNYNLNKLNINKNNNNFKLSYLSNYDNSLIGLSEIETVNGRLGFFYNDVIYLASFIKEVNNNCYLMDYTSKVIDVISNVKLEDLSLFIIDNHKINIFGYGTKNLIKSIILLDYKLPDFQFVQEINKITCDLRDKLITKMSIEGNEISGIIENNQITIKSNPILKKLIDVNINDDEFKNDNILIKKVDEDKWTNKNLKSLVYENIIKIFNNDENVIIDKDDENEKFNINLNKNLNINSIIEKIEEFKPLNNETININENSSIIIINPDSNRTGLTINFPPNPKNGKKLSIISTRILTSTIIKSEDSQIRGNLTQINPNISINFIFIENLIQWIKY